MRILPLVLILLMAAAPLASVPATADDDDAGSGDSDDEESGDADDDDDSGDGPGRARAREWDDDEDRREARHGADQRRAELEHVRREHREAVGLLEPHNGNWTGRFISFSADPATRSLRDLRVGETLLFDAIVLPPPSERPERVEIDVEDNRLRLRGDGWRLGLTDAPAAPLLLRATESSGAFILELPDNVNVTETRYGFSLSYAAPDGPVEARLVGDAFQNGTDTLVVDGEAAFHVSASRVLLDKVANQHRDSLEAALETRALGAEMTILRGGAGASLLVQDATLYEDIELRFESTSSEGDGTTTYVITVDSPSHAGRTIAINIEAGLVDPDFLHLRHFDVDANRTVELPILRADGIADVLDPENDGAVAEYWVVEDTDGVQLLLSMPHFSVHQIELSTVRDIVVEQPSLVVGVVGAAVLVGVATLGMFRRPRDSA